MHVALRPAVDSDFEACRRTYFAEIDWMKRSARWKQLSATRLDSCWELRISAWRIPDTTT